VRARLKAALYVVCRRAISGSGESLGASRDPIASRRFDELMKEARIIVEPVTEAQGLVARARCRQWQRPPPRFNFGDLLCDCCRSQQRLDL